MQRIITLGAHSACRLSAVDIATLKEIGKYTSVILAVSKADMLTVEELRLLSTRVQNQCTDSEISIFSFDESPFLFALSSKQHADSFRTLESLLLKKYMPHLIDSLCFDYFERFRHEQLSKPHSPAIAPNNAEICCHFEQPSVSD